MHRLFVAIRPPPPVRAVLLDAMGGIAGVRWQDEEQLHLTLRFVGEVSPREGEELAAALGHVSAPPFDLALSGVGHFERKGRVHTLWAGVAVSEPLAALQRKIERACQAVGLEPEHRKFAPHLTLARPRAASGPIGEWLATNGALRSAPWSVTDFRLYESHMGPDGSRYQAVARFPLAG
jgi:2'-5' RNA ligase